MGINIIVCVKQVPDPEGPPTSFQVDPVENRVKISGVPPVISPFDESALEAALRIKDSDEARVTLLSLGESHSSAVLLKAMATGADEALLVEGGGLEPQSMDSFTTASLLAAAVRRIGAFDLILTGRQAADTNAGQVGPGISVILGIPAVTFARRIEVSGSKVTVERVVPDGFETVETELPALVTVSHEVGDLRYPSLAAIKEAKGLPVTVLPPGDLDVEPAPRPLLRAVAIEAPSRERSCVIVEDETPEAVGEKLAGRLIEDGVV